MMHWLLKWFVLLHALASAHDCSDKDLRNLRQALLQDESVTVIHRSKCLQRSLKLNHSCGNAIFACPLKIEEKQWGNRIGDYFEVRETNARFFHLYCNVFYVADRQAVACADLSGMHFINTASTFGNHSFFNSFPKVIRHRHPNKNTAVAATNFKLTCPGLGKYAYTDRGAWNQRLGTIKVLLGQAIDKSFPSIEKFELSISTFERILFPEFIVSQTLKMIPDAVILFRCKDVVLSNETNPYGFLNFNLYLQLLSNVSSIYILAEPLDYLSTQRHSHWRSQVCERLGIRLMDFLKDKFHGAIVALRRGYPAESIGMLSRAKTVICAPSTFCLWPGLLNKNKVYLSASIMHFLPYVSDSFYWLWKPSPAHFHHKISPSNTSVEDAVSIITSALMNAKIFEFAVCTDCTNIF